jgi:hypothetical protein
MGVDLYTKYLSCLEEPNVQPMQFRTIHADEQPLWQLISGLSGYMGLMNSKNAPRNLSTPQNETLVAPCPSGLQLPFGFVDDAPRNLELLNCL